MNGTVKNVGSGAGVIAHYVFDSEQGATWPDLPGTLTGDRPVVRVRLRVGVGVADVRAAVEPYGR